MRLILIFVFLAHSAEYAFTQSESIPKGQIIEKVEALNEPSQSYALYLPSNYTPDRKWPVLYAFDPVARGRVPVERFKAAAEKYGWIVLGSNNSRNGPWEFAVDAWNAMLKDSHQRFAIDDERMYATGFSGGARAAVRIGALCNCLSGVIASGAGFPTGLAPSPAMRFVFFGAIGVDDFNFAEVKTLEELLAKAGISHRIQTFDGRHEWSPVAVATVAVQWMELQAIKSGKRPRDDGFISATWEQRFSEAKTHEESKRYLEAYEIYLDLAQSFKGLRDIAQVETKINQLRDHPELKTSIREEQKQLRKQRELESQLGSLIVARERQASSEQTVTGGSVNRTEEGFDRRNQLQALISELRKQSKAAEDSTQRRVSRRVLDGLFAGLIEQGIRLLQTEKNYSESIKRLKIASEADPDRPGVFFYLAWAYAANGDKKKSLQFLSKAVDKGFSDSGTITTNKAFDLIRNDPEYQQIIERLKRQD
ncbi:MAG TPA: hypothetical protein VJM12_14445 [Pyrinomonadaceae bacterium]|nr:hypothetical protein [Pyrinomonadaceae bacterium]